jgi:hypothetical protein
MYAAAKYRMVSEPLIYWLYRYNDSKLTAGVVEKTGGKVIELYSTTAPEKPIS